MMLSLPGKFLIYIVLLIPLDLNSILCSELVESVVFCVPMYSAHLCCNITRFESCVTMLVHYTVPVYQGMSALDCVKFMPIFQPLMLISARVFMVSIDELNCLKT